jgi:hypothetical protein
MGLRIVIVTLALLIGAQGTSQAQNFSFDARKIALGGVSETENLAARMIEEQRPYGSIVLPFGVIQLVGQFNRFDPSNDEFDPVRALEYAVSPVHYIVNRNAGDSGTQFVADIVNVQLNRDLTAYQGFKPFSGAAEGLAAPNWGATIPVFKRRGLFHGVYVGAGPYMSARTGASFDPTLANLLGTDGSTLVPDARLAFDADLTLQLAMAITGGYRGRFPISGLSGERDGIYVAANYNYLHGFRYEDADMAFRIDTDVLGFVLGQPSASPAIVEHVTATSGRGRALDLGVGAVIDRIEFGFGVNGIGNRIDWNNLEVERATLPSLLDGEYVTETLMLAGETRRVELPVNYVGNAAYHHDNWSVLGDYARGFQGTTIHAGYERRFGAFELRGGGRYSRERWHPTAGIGFNLSRRVGLDVAAFGTSANIEREQKLGLAASFRLNRN